MLKIASKPLEARKKQGKNSLYVSEGAWSCFDVRLLPSRSVRKISVASATQYFVMEALGNLYRRAGRVEIVLC